MADTIPAPLKGKVAIITGGSRGIGAAIAELFAQHGCTHIATTYVSNQAKAEAVLTRIRETHPHIKTHAIHSDDYDPAHGPKVVAAALEGLGVDHIDIAIANAAPVEDLTAWPPAAELSHEFWAQQMTGLAWSPVSLATAVIPHMPSGGRIVMVSSVSSKMATGDPVLPYAAGKAAMEAASKQLAVLYVAKGVTVNTISVGPTRTDAFNRGKKWMENWEETAGNATLLKRIAEVEEVASIIAFVASPGAGWITGNQVPANGGAAAMLQS
ncbi:hypothetical protein LTR53_004061 [Teratosphaeriaceae sp. CCFEE 6253]|nr:hypothetical protein LTR53_004061 [Teratosphaeriaceae sp. CCFEE 6253]